MPKVTIVIPVYNAELYVGECLESVFKQTLQDIEVLCINDGSTDASLALLREYAAKDCRVVVIDKDNEGVGKTRNLGILKAKGEFVAFMDPDDFYPDSDILEALYNGAMEHNVPICGGEFVHYLNGQYHQPTDATLSGYYFESDRMMAYSDYQFDYGFHRFIYKREFLMQHDIVYPHYKRYQDPPFFVMAMIAAGDFYALHKVTYAYRMRHNDVQWTDEKVADNLRGIRDVIVLAQQKGLERLERLQITRLTQEYYHRFEGNMGRQSCQLLWQLCQLSDELRFFFFEKNFLATANNLTACAWRYPVYRRRYWYYRMLSHLTFGKRKRHYQSKAQACQQLLRDIRKSCREEMDKRKLKW